MHIKALHAHACTRAMHDTCLVPDVWRDGPRVEAEDVVLDLRVAQKLAHVVPRKVLSVGHPARAPSREACVCVCVVCVSVLVSAKKKGLKLMSSAAVP